METLNLSYICFIKKQNLICYNIKYKGVNEQYWVCPDLRHEMAKQLRGLLVFFGLPTTVSRASPRLICWSTRVAHLAWWVSLPTGIFCIHKRSNPRAPQTCLSDTKLLTTWTNPRWWLISCRYAMKWFGPYDENWHGNYF